VDSDWLSLFFIIHQLDNIILKVIPIISFLCAFIVVVWTILWCYSFPFMIFRTISFIVIVVVLGVKGL